VTLSDPESPLDAVRTAAAARLARRLLQGGWIRRQSTYRAFATVPRDRLIERVYTIGRAEDGSTTWRSMQPSDGGADWIEMVYEDQPLAVALDPVSGRPSSSSTAPWLMACMIEALGVKEQERVLEIGTGTGYNAAILANIVGSRGRVVSVESDPDLAARAAGALQELGSLSVSCQVGDGMLGWPGDAPYDRVEVTVGSEALWDEWLEQLRIGGRLVACVQGLQGGAIVCVVKHAPDHASGRFLDMPPLGFTHASGGGRTNTYDELLVAAMQVDSSGAGTMTWHRRHVEGAIDWSDISFGSSFLFWLQFALPGTWLVRSSGTGEAVSLVDPLRRWIWTAQPDNPNQVDVRGPDEWWSLLDSEYREWSARGRPGCAEFVYRWRGRDRHSVELRPRAGRRTLRSWKIRRW
jgi:protein-L-isoaspartate(D-aspartate) O-methyltransferase